MVRALVIDDHALVRAGIAQLLGSAADIDVVGEASDAATGFELACAERPDVAIVDVSLGDGPDGIELTSRLTARGLPTKVLVLTTAVDRALLDRALAAGARGIVLKEAEPGEFVRAVRAVAKGDRPLDPKAARLLLEDPPTGAPAPTCGPLTARQSEVLTLVANGCSNKQVARALGISEKTVKAHLTTVYQLLSVPDRTAAAVWLLRQQAPAR